MWDGVCGCGLDDEVMCGCVGSYKVNDCNKAFGFKDI